MGNYSTWLDERKADFHDPIEAMRMGTPAPKGVLLCGVPGTGKTAAARETARRLGVPLIKFDISRIQTKDFGGSEERLRRYLDRISAFGSCVMLMDEIEKVKTYLTPFKCLIACLLTFILFEMPRHLPFSCSLWGYSLIFFF